MAERRCIFGTSFGEISILSRIGRPAYRVEDGETCSIADWETEGGRRKMRSPDRCFHNNIYSYMRVEELVHDGDSCTHECVRVCVYDARYNYDKVNVKVSGGPAGTAVDRQRQGM